MFIKKLIRILSISFIVFSKVHASGHNIEFYRNNYNYTFLSAININDPYTEYLNSIPPVLQTLSIINSGTGKEAIVTKRIVFGSKKGTNKVYAIISSPLLDGKYPAILLLHGGSGNADGLKLLIEYFARKGYVTLTLDMPGVCGITITPNSDGPWKLRPESDEGPRFNVAYGPENSTLVDVEVAGIEAFNLLRSQPNLVVKNIGIIGYSWGGYSTTFLAGILGDKVKAAYSVFGCDYYELGSFWKTIIDAMTESDKNVWLKYIDAGRRAKNMKASFFLEATTNDKYFWPEAVSATMYTIPSEKKWSGALILITSKVPLAEKYRNCISIII